MSLVWRWFQDKRELYSFVFFLVTGFAASVLAFRFLNGYPFNFGKNLAGAFVPPFLCVCYATYTGYRNSFTTALLVKTLLLYLLQLIPLVPLLHQVFLPTPLDDFSRYYLYAKNMVEQHTLWGGDRMYFPDAGYHYATQPGYRYFIAAELFLFKKLYRFTQFFNIALLITATFYFQKALKKTVANKQLLAGVFLLVILFTPYATKNLLMGLSEWLTALLLMTVCYLYSHKKSLVLCLFILALAPFFRQNILVGVLLLAAAIVFTHAGKAKLLLAFLLSLLLPLYHNLYYAGEWRFFVKLFATPLINETKPAGVDFWVLLNNLWRLVGCEKLNGRLYFDLLGFAFLPLSWLVYACLLLQFRLGRQRIFYAFTTVGAALPGLFLGKDYYPRFEYVSVVFFLVSFCILSAVFAPKRPPIPPTP